MPYRYPRAVGKQPPQGQLGWSFLDWFSDYEKPAPLRRSPSVDNFWNAGVNMAYGREAAYTPHVTRSYPARYGGDTMLKKEGYRRDNRRGFFSLWGEPSADVGVEEYNRAVTAMAYGNTGAAHAELGDFFNDVMGAVIPGWDSRPDWMKQITIKPDAEKVIAMAQKVAPNAGESIVRAANKIGMGVYVNTPAGQVEVTPQNAQNLYGLYPFISRAQSAVGSVPMWVWLAGGGGLLLLFLMRR